MARFLLRRTLQGLAIVLAVVTLTFALLRAAPGDAVDVLLADARATDEVREQLRERYGLDQPLLTQYGRYLSGLVRGDFGFSISQQRPVGAVLADAIPNTLLLTTAALLLAFASGILLGALQGARTRSRFDRVASWLTTAFATIPDFWLATGVMLLFAFKWRLFPVSGMVDPVMHDLLPWTGRVRDVLWHMVLPALTLALILGSIVARYQRSAMIDAWGEPYLRSARAAGVPWRRLVLRHALRNALLPVITLLGLAFPALIGGAVFVETVFAWPGMGRVAVDAVMLRDYPLVLAVVTCGSALVAIGGIVADVLYAAVDPRIRHG